MAVQVQNTELTPGDSLELDIYFSGYGEIEGSKLFFSTAKGIFQEDSSYVKHSLYRDGNYLDWGRTTQYMKNPSRFSLTFSGLKLPDWKEPSIYLDFDDRDSNNYILISERDAIYAPIHIHFPIKQNAPSGNYYATLVYTYFNGQEWVGSTQRVDFKIDNWVEAHPRSAWGIGILVAIIVVIPFPKYWKWAKNHLTWRLIKSFFIYIKGIF